MSDKLVLLHMTNVEALLQILSSGELIPTNLQGTISSSDENAKCQLNLKMLLNCKILPSHPDLYMRGDVNWFHMIGPNRLLTIEQAIAPNVITNEQEIRKMVRESGISDSDSKFDDAVTNLKKEKVCSYLRQSGINPEDYFERKITEDDVVKSYHNGFGGIGLLFEFDEEMKDKFVSYYTETFFQRLLSGPYQQATQEIKPYHWFLTNGAIVVSPFKISLKYLKKIYVNDFFNPPTHELIMSKLNEHKINVVIFGKNKYAIKEEQKTKKLMLPELPELPKSPKKFYESAYGKSHVEFKKTLDKKTKIMIIEMLYVLIFLFAYIFNFI